MNPHSGSGAPVGLKGGVVFCNHREQPLFRCTGHIQCAASAGFLQRNQSTGLIMDDPATGW
ncbi:MAG: hypothetical protein VR64_05640 [Desulfatitalea sp. BRH_c12]|nr:MAG: hypothetical protein VR64_05640 [Desulfatitalea sp. BRH_c12]